MGGRRLGMADVTDTTSTTGTAGTPGAAGASGATGTTGVITYREAVAEGIARELRRDPSVVCLGEDIGAAGGGFKTTAGLFAEFGKERVWDTPISEQAILGVAMGGYMTGGQVTVPLVVRTANGGGLGFGAQHSQAVENWTLAVPGLKIAAPSTPADVTGMMAAAIRSDAPVVFFEHKGLFASKGAAGADGHGGAR